MSSSANSVFLALLFVLNYVDALFTLVWIRLGIASEANPLMEVVVHDPVLFMGVKLVMVTLCCILLYRFKERWTAQIATRLGFAVYLGILGIHTAFVVRLIQAPIL